MGAEVVARGPAARAAVTPALLDALTDRFGIRTGRPATDLGGSQNLNLLVTGGDGREHVVRVYRPWLTTARLADMQAARRHLAAGNVPCPLPIRTRDGAS